jgi:multiple sugar transport system ATP-binding protein
MATLNLRQVVKEFDATRVIHGVDLAVADGDFVVFVGPSGCGKSTLLRLICGLESATSGDIEIDGKRVNDVAAADRGLAMVFQSYALYPHMTIRQNMAFGLENIGTPRETIAMKVRDAARLLQLDALLDRRPTQLSGGQRQRVAIGRAIVREPRIFLFDEPLSNLDAELRVSMRTEITSLHQRLAATMIYVTHDQVEAMTMADKIVVLRAGRIEQVGAPLELYNRPANRFVAGFIGSPQMNFLPVTVAGRDAEGIAATLPGGRTLPGIAARTAPAAGTVLTLGVRPEHLVLPTSAADAQLSVTVLHLEQLGAHSLLHGVVTDGETRVTVHVAGQTRVRAGDTVGVTIAAGDARLFADDDAGLAI